MIPSSFEYFAPTTLSEAQSLLRRYVGDAKVVAGGHSLIPLMKMRLSEPKCLIDLGGINELSYIREDNGGLAIGATTTYYDIESSPLVNGKYPMLAEATALVADIQVRNKGTIGGSMAHADPSADLTAVVLALECEMRSGSSKVLRSVPAHRFFVDTFTTTLRENEILTEIKLPAVPAKTGGAYKKFANKASHFAEVGVAALVTMDNGICQRVRIGVTGAGSIASRARAAERVLEGKEPTEKNIALAAQRAIRGVEFQSNIHASSEYRSHLTTVYTRRALAEAVSRAG